MDHVRFFFSLEKIVLISNSKRASIGAVSWGLTRYLSYLGELSLTSLIKGGSVRGVRVILGLERRDGQSSSAIIGFEK